MAVSNKFLAEKHKTPFGKTRLDERVAPESAKFFLCGHVMAIDIIAYLREAAHNCIQLARSCPHRETAHGLEALAADFMSRALELEDSSRQ